ncbi:putative Flp pilus-assembly TadE/G-like protein [Paucimonas lemoignei]|uniref:Putative Flp pilus-assembly TadE/G-like protein n=1 Tax=Paucimonas lemoignei TaxID=29443 RepID=A0A4V2UIU6_PAULE|nr:pilus assembly protein TadG-related protein [Paucimonas lemoignei]TCS37550.1 putative Flp pilus-assembly TadE/G-like protein [Paucimonas lemoignei]
MSVSPHLIYQRGQALVFSLVTVVIILLVMVSMYTMGQQSINKMRLQNAADAAAYSAVQAEARDYNFSAYTNRAVIANQVAVAQVVGLTSWAKGYAATYNGPSSWVPQVLSGLGGPLAKIFWDTPVKAYKPASKAFGKAMETAGPIAVKLLDVLIDVLNAAQMVYHYGTALTVAQTIGLSPAAVIDKLPGVDVDSLGVVKDLLSFNEAYNVIKLNDKDADLSTPGMAAAIVHLAQWFMFTSQKDPNVLNKDGAQADRMAQVTKNSLDGFSKNRNTEGGGPGNIFPAESMYLTPFVVDPTRLIPYQNGALLMMLWHRGGTELKKVGAAKKTWSAMDGTGFFGAAIFWISILGIPIPIPIIIPFLPMGWGAAQAGQSSNLLATNNFDTEPSDAYGGIYNNPMTAGAAGIQAGKGAGSTMDSKAGLRKYFDVKNDTKPNLQGPPLVLEIEKADTNIPTSNKISGGQLTLQNGTRSGYMRSLSKAEVYFSRPKKLFARGDGKTELASLYSPYWQARLAPNSFLEQYASMSYQLW